MGKPYDLELSQLDGTYRWAVEAPVDELCRALRSASSLPLLAVGSGGSLTTADFAAGLHRDFSGMLGSAMTPMEATVPSLELRGMAVLLATAGGKNPDVLAAFRGLASREPRRLIVLCMSVGSPLGRLATKRGFVDLIEAELPSGRDGFLATNSLLASTVLLARAYNQACGVTYALPEDISALLHAEMKGLTAELDRRYASLWQRETLVVLHGPATRSAAMDLESKFTEAALGNVQLADYRHFAHGRHHWLAKHPDTTGILAFVTSSDEEIALRTLDLIPGNIPVWRIAVPHEGSAAGIAALVWGLQVVGSAGHARGINPGRPGVPSFGRRIYHLKAIAHAYPDDAAVPSREAAALERKTGSTIGALARSGQLREWRVAYTAFVQRLAKGSFRAVVLDYDGTVCDEADRFAGLCKSVGRELVRLLRAGVMLGFATGRGKSVKEALREQIPKKYQSRVVVGYYNGGDVGHLDDDHRPDGSEGVADALKPVADAIQGHPLLRRVARFELRLPQIQVTLAPGARAELVWGLLQQVVYAMGVPGVGVVASSHSMDILAPGVSKHALVDRLAGILGCDEDSVLCIGDRGQWPGNDFSLLHGPNGLSVDEVSRDPITCWNLAPPELRGPDAAIAYLGQLRGSKGALRMRGLTTRRRK